MKYIRRLRIMKKMKHYRLRGLDRAVARNIHHLRFLPGRTLKGRDFKARLRLRLELREYNREKTSIISGRKLSFKRACGAFLLLLIGNIIFVLFRARRAIVAPEH